MQESYLNKLKEIENSGDYVFHGSPFEIEIFEPRQAYNTADEVEVPDGEPAVFASQKLDYAIFMAIINIKNCPRGYRSSSNGKIFKATKKTLEQITQDSDGFVYVFNKDDFLERSNGEEECVSYKPVKPLYKYPVSFSDITFEILELE